MVVFTESVLRPKKVPVVRLNDLAVFLCFCLQKGMLTLSGCGFDDGVPHGEGASVGLQRSWLPLFKRVLKLGMPHQRQKKVMSQVYALTHLQRD